MRVVLASLAAVAFLTEPLWAAKIPEDVRAAFEQRFLQKRTYLVSVQKGIPTTSIYGVQGESTDAYFSIDVTGESEWKTSAGLLDSNQTAADFLSPGEILELVEVSMKDNRIDLRTVSVESHKVTRGSGFLGSTKREPVSTNFKFFFPFPKSKVLTKEDLPEMFRLVEAYVRPFPNEAAARAFVAQVTAGAAAPAPRAGTAAPRASEAQGGKKEIKVGMTPLEVIEVLGKPQKELSFESRVRWTYPDLTVIFENGRVKEVKF